MKVRQPYRLFIHLFLAAGGFFMLYPLIYTFLGALMDPFEFSRSSSLFPLARLPNWRVFWDMLVFQDMTYWIRNTAIRIVWYVIWTVTTSLMLGYYFSKFRFAGKQVMFYSLLATMMIPGVTTMVPTYVMYARFPFAGGNDVFTGGTGIINTWGVMLLPGLVSVYSMFLVKQMYDSLPNEYDESARIDGAKTYQVIFRIYAPMLVPVIAVIFIGDFVGIWNDFMTNLLFTDAGGGRHLTMIAYGVSTLPALIGREMVDSQYVTDFPGLFAGALLACIPTIVMYLFMQKYIVQGLAMSGLKG